MIQAIANNVTRYKVTQGNDYVLWGSLAGLYMISWVVVEGDMAFPIRMAASAGFVILMLTSYFNATVVLLTVLFVPFIGELMGQEISGVKLPRVLFLVYVYMSWKMKSVRKLQFDRKTIFLLFFSIFVIIVFADIQQTLQTVPLSSGQSEARGIKNYLAQFFDQFFIGVFLLLSFVKLNNKQLNNLYNAFILIGFLQALNVIYLFAIHPEKVMFGAGFDSSYLWESVHLGHKNDWGMMFVFMFFITLNRYFLEKENKMLYLIAMVASVMAIGISLSRQAYVWLVLGFMMVSFWQKNTRIIMYFLLGVVAIVIIQPAFIMDRIETLTAVESLEDAKTINRKISDLSIDQAISYFTLIPRVFVIDWEYNWSEGFWVGLLHNTGIIGFFWIIWIYFKFFMRYRAFYLTKNIKLRSYGILLMTFLVLMFLANFNRRWAHFVHYDGNIGQIGFIVMFMMFYAELFYFNLKQKLDFRENL